MLIRKWRSRPYRWLAVAFVVICAGLLARPQTLFLFRSSGAYFVWLKDWLTVIPHSGFWPAFWGALISPGKGLIVYAPFVILAAFAWLVAWRSAWPKLLAPTLWLATIVAAQSIFYDYRWTNSQWGARYLLSALPALAAAALPGLHWLWQRSPRAAWIAWSGALGAGILTQLPGVLIPPPAYSAVVLEVDRRAFFDLAIWNPAYSAITGHWRLILAGQPWGLAWVRNFAINPAGVLLTLIGLTVGIVAAALILRSASAALPSSRQMIGALGLAAAAALLAPFAALSAYRADPAYFGDQPAFGEAVQLLNTRVENDDLIVVRGYLDPFWYCYFNFGRPRGTWAGLPTFDGPANDTLPGDPFYFPGIDADVADVALFESAPGHYRRLWLVVDASLPAGTEGLDVEAWLREHNEAVGEWVLAGTDQVRIVLFSLQRIESIINEKRID